MTKPTRKELLNTIGDLLRLICEIDKPFGGTIYQEQNPYGRPAVKSAMKKLARERGINDWLDVRF